ncbi:MAG: hypothetical protein Q9161_004956 [Pseudevernia consocians]
MLENIMSRHSVMPEFLSAVRCFQDKTSNVEQAFGGTSWKVCAQNLKEMVFVLKYPEHNGRSDGADPWSIRQTCVYQSFDPLTTSSLWMLVNPRENTAADSRIEGLLNAPEGFLNLHQQPPLIGLVVLSTYFANWRTYMAFQEKEVLRMSLTVIGADIDDKLQFSHATLSALRRIEDRLLLLPSILQSLIQDIDMLRAFADAVQGEESFLDFDHCTTQEVLQNYTTMAAAYSQNATFLRDKIRGTAQLLSDTLNLKHQKNAQSISENTLALTNAAVNDSATIRVITVVTLSGHFKGQAKILERQSSAAITLDSLSASHRHLEITSVDEPAKLRTDFVDILQEAIKDGGKNIEAALETMTEILTALVSDNGVLAKELKTVESLLFPMISERRQRIIEAHPRTYDWLFEEINVKAPERPGVSVLDWLRTGKGTYWVSGKAGSGNRH